MTRRLPPLSQLRAFEAASRHLSFKDAADELGVTQSAVSHQIRTLEDSLGAQLFQRLPQGVRLTDRAVALAAELTGTLDRMEAALNRFEGSAMTGTLRLSVAPWYGNRILLPNIEAFRAANPGLELELEFSYALIDFRGSEFDAAVRHGSGNWPGLSGYLLQNNRVSPVCAPSLVAGRQLPLSPEAILEMDLVVPRGYEDSWHAWFAAVGIGNCRPNFIFVEHRGVAGEFARDGNGVSLPNLSMARDELRSGQLVRLHPTAITLDSGIFLVFPETQHPDPRLRVVADWLKAAIAALDS